MSDNGPHMQPPQYPPGGDGHAQPGGPYGGGPYGPPGPGQGDPSTGGQAPYPGGPYPGQDPYGGGPPHDPYGGAPQYQPPPGAQPPYGPGGPGGPGPGGPGEMPGYPPPKKSNAGLFVVIGGGVVIFVLIVLVVVMLVRTDSGGDNPPVASEEGTSDEEGGGEGDDESEESDSKDEEEVETNVGEPPHALPETACDAFSESSLEEMEGSQSRTNSTEDYINCTWSVVSEEGYPGEMTVEYALPWSASDSVEAAQDDFQSRVDRALDDSSDIILKTVEDSEEVDVGDEAMLVLNSMESVWNYSEAHLIVRQDNMLIEISWTADPMDILDESAPAPLEFSEVSSVLPDLGREALNNLG